MVIIMARYKSYTEAELVEAANEIIEKGNAPTGWKIKETLERGRLDTIKDDLERLVEDGDIVLNINNSVDILRVPQVAEQENVQSDEISEVYSLEYYLENKTGLTLNSECKSAAGIGAGNGIYLSRYSENKGDSVVLVAIDSQESDVFMINRFKIFESEESYDDYVEECSNVNGFHFMWNDWNFALNMYKNMDRRNCVDDYELFDY